MAPGHSGDTIRILVSTDNHVGYNERDPIRGDDSWKTFHEIMCLAKERDVDMVLLAGDLFHDNKPSRKALFQVMRSLRMNCYGEKPCELEMLSDASEQFAGAFNHVNYEDPDINVAIPVFSIHGNHDDPSGEGHLAPLDILQMSGLINYYGRTPESDNIQVKPVLLQKGTTKLALYGMSNVRDERLFRTFRDGNVRFFQPNTHRDEWFNLGSVHQNHHAYTESGYLPENFLPEFLDLVIWGHEHECKIDPITNVEMGFKVIQPGSSVATSLVNGESVTKSVTILSITGKKCEYEPIRLKTVRPFVQRDIALQDDRKLRELALSGGDNKPAINRYCMNIIDDMILEANQMWADQQQEGDDDAEEEKEVPKPLIRLRVEYTAPEGGKFDVDNPQRFSAKYVGKVANTTDVIQYHRKKTTTRRTKETIELPDAATLAQLGMDSVKMEELVKEFLSAQSLTVFPQNAFGDAVTQFVDKDDKHAMEEFVQDTVQNQVAHLVGNNAEDEVDYDLIAEMMEGFKAQMEKRFEKGDRAAKKRSNRKLKPDSWDSDMDGHWEDDPASIIRDNDGEDEDEEDGDDVQSTTSRATTTRGRGRGRARGGRAAAAGTTRKTATAAAAKKAPAKTTAVKGRGKKKAATPPSDEEEEEDEDVVMIDDDDDDDAESGLFMTQDSASIPPPTRKTPARTTKTPARSGKAAATQSTGRQSKLNFSQSQANGSGRSNGTNGKTPAARSRRQEPSEDEISDDDAFEPPPAASRRR